MPDIKNKNDIKVFVDTFYGMVQKDALIGPIFQDKIQSENWSKHLERMYQFWNTVLFGAADYYGNPFSHHSSLPIEAPHFDKWLSLFTQAIEKDFSGPKSEELKMRAQKMALLFQSKLKSQRNDGLKIIM